jgi:hypothetical protein
VHSFFPVESSKNDLGAFLGALAIIGKRRLYRPSGETLARLSARGCRRPSAQNNAPACAGRALPLPSDPAKIDPAAW